MKSSWKPHEISMRYEWNLWNLFVIILESFYNLSEILLNQGFRKLLKSGGSKPKSGGGKNKISAKICLFLTNFALLLAKVGGQLTPLPPCFRRPLSSLYHNFIKPFYKFKMFTTQRPKRVVIFLNNHTLKFSWFPR